MVRHYVRKGGWGGARSGSGNKPGHWDDQGFAVREITNEGVKMHARGPSDRCSSTRMELAAVALGLTAPLAVLGGGATVTHRLVALTATASARERLAARAAELHCGRWARRPHKQTRLPLKDCFNICCMSRYVAYSICSTHPHSPDWDTPMVSSN